MIRLVQKMFSHRQLDYSQARTPISSEPISSVAVLESVESTLVRETPTQSPVQASHPTDVFLSEDALAINDARLCHLASLGLEIAGKKVLEVGGGIGLHTCFFESLGCDVLFTEARPENLAEARRRYPNRKSLLLDLDTETDLSHLGRFDVVYCYGTLYHLSRPAEALKSLATICDGMILLETCVTPGNEDQQHPEVEPSEVANQAASGLGCRPTRTWVMKRLEEYFGHAYQTVTQPQHADFECNWLAPEPRKLYRAVFVGSKNALAQPTLSKVPCTLQTCVPDDTQGVWIDVGAHLGETTFEKARKQPNLHVYAFEPNLELASQRFNQLPNYSMLPMAVGERDGFSVFHLNAFSAASSLLPLDEARHREWIGGELLQQQAEVLVPTTRLDSFLAASGVSHVDYLKIDAQGADFLVVRSAGKRLGDIRKIKLEVTITPTQLYVGGASKEEFIQYLTAHGFVLISEQSQTYGQEENLVFFQLGSRSDDSRPGNLQLPELSDSEWLQILRPLSDQQILATAVSVAELRPLGPYPGWYFSCHDLERAPLVRLRQAIWNICHERRLQIPVRFPWYDGSTINLHLGNDVSCPTFIGGCIEPNEFAFVDAFLKPGMIFVDIGANEGSYSVFASKRVGPSGKLIAFEPSEREYGRLQANLALNDLGNFQTEKIALAEAEGKGVLRLCEYGHEGQNTLGNFAHNVLQDGTQNVDMSSLDEYLETHPITRLDFIKIDVEGSEQRVLEGARRTLAKYRPVVLLELNDAALQFQGASCESVANFLRSIDYAIYNFSTVTGLPVLADRPPYSENVLAAPRETSIYPER